jgi:hypothetical protein
MDVAGYRVGVPPKTKISPYVLRKLTTFLEASWGGFIERLRRAGYATTVEQVRYVLDDARIKAVKKLEDGGQQDAQTQLKIAKAIAYFAVVNWFRKQYGRHQQPARLPRRGGSAITGSKLRKYSLPHELKQDVDSLCFVRYFEMRERWKARPGKNGCDPRVKRFERDILGRSDPSGGPAALLRQCAVELVELGISAESLRDSIIEWGGPAASLRKFVSESDSALTAEYPVTNGELATVAILVGYYPQMKISYPTTMPPSDVITAMTAAIRSARRPRKRPVK